MEKAFELSGGYGWFQVCSSFFMIMAMGSVAFFLYAFSFLEHRPQYQCLNSVTSTWEVCTTAAFCPKDSQVQWRVNFEDADSIHNLIEQLNFHCEPDYKIGLFGSCFLLGMVVGCVTLTRMGDVYGRKRVFLAGMCSQVLATIGLLVSHEQLIHYILLLVLGWAVTGKQFVGYSYLIELQPESKQVMTGSIEFMFEAVAYFSVCAFFYWVSKQWHYVMIPTIILAVVGTSVTALFIPESPRYLVC